MGRTIGGTKELKQIKVKTNNNIKMKRKPPNSRGVNRQISISLGLPKANYIRGILGSGWWWKDIGIRKGIGRSIFLNKKSAISVAIKFRTMRRYLKDTLVIAIKGIVKSITLRESVVKYGVRIGGLRQVRRILIARKRRGRRPKQRIY